MADCVGRRREKGDAISFKTKLERVSLPALPFLATSEQSQSPQ
jgi:hypothetical protein